METLTARDVDDLIMSLIIILCNLSNLETP